MPLVSLTLAILLVGALVLGHASTAVASNNLRVAMALPLRQEVVMPGASLRLPFSSGILSCAACQPPADGSAAVMLPCTLKISGQQGRDAQGKLPPGVANQTKLTMEAIRGIVTKAGAAMDDITACEIWLAHINDFAAMNKVYASFFTKPYPTRAAAGGYANVGGALVEITCEATAPCPFS